jgi:hypothetical protein
MGVSVCHIGLAWLGFILAWLGFMAISLAIGLAFPISKLAWLGHRRGLVFSLALF